MVERDITESPKSMASVLSDIEREMRHGTAQDAADRLFSEYFKRGNGEIKQMVQELEKFECENSSLSVHLQVSERRSDPNHPSELLPEVSFVDNQHHVEKAIDTPDEMIRVSLADNNPYTKLNHELDSKLPEMFRTSDPFELRAYRVFTEK